MELVQQVARAFNGARDQLWEEHHIERVIAEMPFSLLVAAIHLDDITHALESVERQADGQNDMRQEMGLYAQRGTELVEIGGKKVQILENQQHRERTHDADDEKCFLQFVLVGITFHQDTRRIIDDDGDQQDEDVLGHKPHVEHAAGRQQHQPSPLVGQQVEQQHHNGQEDEEFYGIEYHKTLNYSLFDLLYRSLQNLVAK